MMQNSKPFKQDYYIEHTLWERNFNADEINKFDNLRFDDTIILHFDFIYTIFKTKTSKHVINKNIIFDAINVCLRMYQKIKKLYPYNRVYVIIHAEKQALKRLIVDVSAFQALIDIIPGFAIVTDKKDPDLEYYNKSNYKHIIYGKCNGLKTLYLPENYQTWLILNGKLYITK